MVTVLLVVILGMDGRVEQKNWDGNDDGVGAAARNTVLFLAVEGVTMAVVVSTVNADNAVLLLKHEEVEMTTNLQQISKRNGTGNQRDEN